MKASSNTCYCNPPHGIENHRVVAKIRLSESFVSKNVNSSDKTLSESVLEEKNSSGEAQLTKSRQKYSHTDDNNDDDETTSSVFLVN
jgi:hypothetical protein